MTDQQTILIIDDDRFVYLPLSKRLETEGYRVLVAPDGGNGLTLAKTIVPDLVILDIMMPEVNGHDVCRRIRADSDLAHIPVLMLTANDDKETLKRSFLSGADDFMTKPCDGEELALRVKALLRRSTQLTPHVEADDAELEDELIVGQIVLNHRTYQVKTEKGTILLTNMQYALLQFLMSNAGRIFTTRDLLQNVWKYPQGKGSPELVRTHVRNLREKIEVDSRNPQYIRTVQGHGYTFSTGQSTTASA